MENGWGDTLLPGYGAVYPLGLLLVILFVQVIPRILKIDMAKDFEEHREKNDQEEIHLQIRKFLVENTAVLHRTLGELDFRDATGATLSRVRRRGRILIPHAETSLKSGDVVLAVGTAEALEKVHKLVGHETHESLEIDPRVEARQIVITNPSLHHVKLDTLGLGQHYHVVITRLWRSGMEIPPSDYCVIELGDTLLAVGKMSNLDRLMRFLGKRERALGEIDLISMSFGIVMGIVLGRISVALPGIGTLAVGNAGGTLLVGLFLGYVRRFGFLTGAMSPSAKMVIKELGLSLFIAGIGASAGAGLIDVNFMEISRMLLASCIILVFTMTTVFLIAYKVLHMDLTRSLACLCGGMVSSIALGSVTSMAKSEEPASTFAACYPLSLFGSILGTQVLAFLVR
jgi:putative transport protein